jgi:hypothetical protein
MYRRVLFVRTNDYTIFISSHPTSPQGDRGKRNKIQCPVSGDMPSARYASVISPRSHKLSPCACTIVPSACACTEYGWLIAKTIELVMQRAVEVPNLKYAAVRQQLSTFVCKPSPGHQFDFNALVVYFIRAGLKPTVRRHATPRHATPRHAAP